MQLDSVCALRLCYYLAGAVAVTVRLLHAEDSKGANCMPMDKVIASGEIERYTKEKQETCRGSRCKKGESAEIGRADELPALATPEIKLETIEVQG